MKGHPIACIVSQVCSWNIRESRGRICLSHSLSLLGAKSWQTEKRNLSIWTSHIRTEKCWTDLKTSKICETDLIFWRASAEQQKWQQRGHTENWLHHQHSWQWENSLDWQQISRSGKIHSAASQVHMQTRRKLKCTAEPAGCSRGWAHCQAAVTGEPDSVATPWWPGLPWDWLILIY